MLKNRTIELHLSWYATEVHCCKSEPFVEAAAFQTLWNVFKRKEMFSDVSLQQKETELWKKVLYSG